MVRDSGLATHEGDCLPEIEYDNDMALANGMPIAGIVQGPNVDRFAHFGRKGV